MAHKVIVRDDFALPFLHIQRGGIFQLRGDPEKWWTAYNADLAATFESFADYLPPACERVLDIGGGMGGIDALIATHYAQQPEVVIVDGIADEAVVSFHARTFNSAVHGERFLALQGVERVAYIAPAVALGSRIGPCDLVLSIQAWPFHIPVDEYLNLARRVLKPDGLLLVDVRKNDDVSPRALAQAAFRPYQVIGDFPKFKRVLYVRL